MICEFALTPEIFSSDAHADRELWLSSVRDFVAALFPKTNQLPACISNLYDGGWESEAGKLAVASAPEIRGDVAKLLSRLQDLLVKRDPVGDWPGDEDAWAMEASLCSARQLQISQIWASNECCGRLGGHNFATLHDVSYPARWNDFRPTRRIPLTVGDQLAALRMLTFHSSWLAYIDPYIHGSTADDELELALAF